MKKMANPLEDVKGFTVGQLAALVHKVGGSEMVRGVLSGEFELSVSAKKFACSFADLIPEEWTVVEDVAPSAFDISKLKPVSFLKSGESSIGGEEMRRRAVKFKANLGLADGKRMLVEQDKIPAEFRDFYIVLSGTVLRDSDGYLRVPDLYFLGGRWVLDFNWLGSGWLDSGRFARCE